MLVLYNVRVLMLCGGVGEFEDESTFKRELGERKAAKQNVVMRRLGRPMLQET